MDQEGRPHGLTVNSFASVSLDPPLVLWSLRRQAWTFRLYKEAPRFAVNVLAADQLEIASRFSRRAEDRFAGISVVPGLGGVPLIRGCLAHLECLTQDRFPGGDHLVFVGLVQGVARAEGVPLAYSGGGFATVTPYEARA